MRGVLLQILQDSPKAIPAKSTSELIGNYWFWITMVELALIVFLLFKLFKLRQKTKFQLRPEGNEILQTSKESNIDTNSLIDSIQTSKESNIDMNDVMDSIHKSRDLYKRLSARCHPDRFIDADLNKKADVLFQEITRNQRNYKKLLELKEIAQSQLNITV